MAGAVGRRRLTDRIATLLFSAGGLFAVLLILGMLAFLVWEVVPLFVPASATPSAGPRAIPENIAGCTGSERGDHVLAWTRSGELLRIENTGAVHRGPQLCAAPALIGSMPGSNEVAALAADGAIVLARFSEIAPADAASRAAVVPGWALQRVQLEPMLPAAEVAALSGRLGDDGAAHVAVATNDGRLLLRHSRRVDNMFTGESELQHSTAELRLSAAAQILRITADGKNVVAALANGRIACVVEADAEHPVLREQEAPGVTLGADIPAYASAIAPLFGEQAWVVACSDGAVGVWFLMRNAEGAPHLDFVRSFPALSSAARLIAPAWRDKSFMVADAAGVVSLCHSTSGREVWRGRSGLKDLQTGCLAVKGDGATLLGANDAVLLRIDNPHPDISFSAWFLPVRYEGYGDSSLTWQSSSGNDDYEPKLSLLPLLFGTLKGTLFALLLAVPLGVGAAIFSSQFLGPRLRGIVKPVVEMMASLPSVVLGFIAGLWLAPILERVLPGVFLLALALPAGAIIAGTVMRWAAKRGWIPGKPGAALLGQLLAVVGSVAFALWISPSLERAAFGGDARMWLREMLGLTYDQRNALVVALGMGFAVIPIVFSLADEALSNVPRSLVLGSLALGADRWETVRRVVLPAAGPGVFAAIMVGFGRALGETMIVLMATGNTPIMSLSPFNGLRTLSANIATEIPEAPHGGTLYRTLFLSVLLLFVLNLAVNSVADRVRERLRRKHGAL